MAAFWMFVLFVFVSLRSVTLFEAKWFDQVLDHFTFSAGNDSGSTFKQKYLVEDKWWDRQDGPIFFYTGNEAPISYFWENIGFPFNIAPQFKALVVFAEHRYYGDSLPFGTNQSFIHPHIDLLTVEQALADFATLITHIKEERNASKSPVIAFGGSYGGMLSAYMRFKFPNIVDGAIAASAPIFLVGRVVDRSFFFADVTKDFRNAVTGCDTKVKKAFIEMGELSITQAGLKQISSSFKLCQPLKSTDEYKQQLVGWIRNAFTTLAMFDYPYQTSELPANPVKVACQKLVNAADPMKGLAEAAGLAYGKPKCFDIWTEYVQCADPTGCGTGPQSFAWDYQACTEMLMPAGSNNVSDMFPELSFTLEERSAYCEKRWHIKPRLDWMKINMWGKDIQHSSNIVFSNGNLDPWRRGGVAVSQSKSLIAVLIDGGAHHLDLRAANPHDPPSVKRARNLEISSIHKWIKQAQRKHRRH